MRDFWTCGFEGNLNSESTKSVWERYYFSFHVGDVSANNCRDEFVSDGLLEWFKQWTYISHCPLEERPSMTEASVECTQCYLWFFLCDFSKFGDVSRPLVHFVSDILHLKLFSPQYRTDVTFSLACDIYTFLIEYCFCFC